MSDDNTDGPESKVEAALAERLAQLDLETKVRLLTGAYTWSIPAVPEIGLRRVVLADGPVGVRGEQWDERYPSANLPSPTALAASWDPRRVAALGGLLAVEARRKGVDVVLAPTVNLHRTPYGGRHFECFSEDPLLTARIGAAYVAGLQGGGVAATAKHFVANDSETDRFTVDVHVDERTLRELYLAPFEVIARQAGVWAVMSSYNGVNGPTMTEHPMLNDVLKREWGFDGVVVSDWLATRSTVDSAVAGLDLVMPGPDGPWGESLVEAVTDGDVPEAAVDDKVLRILRLAARVGALDGVPAAGDDGGALPPGGWALDGVPVPAVTDADWPADRVSAELRAAATAGFVLVRNEGAVLPLDAGTLRRVAVIGPNAAAARTLGGGSATVFPPYAVSPLAGLRAALEPEVEVVHAVGARVATRLPVAPIELLRDVETGEPGITVRLLAEDGTVLRTEHRRYAQLTWHGGFGSDLDTNAVTAIEMAAKLVPSTTGGYEVGCSGIGEFRLAVDGEVRYEGLLTPPPDLDAVDAFTRLPQWSTTLDLVAGEETDLLLRYAVVPGGFMVKLELNVDAALGDPAQELARAAELAGSADVAVVVVGTTEEVESEGFDRTSLCLPGAQDDLVRAVLAANPRTVVVVNSGAPVLIPAADRVPAALLTWFPGQEFGNALADVLLGVAEPGGRLPVTWPADEPAWLPTGQPVDGVLEYAEGIHVGYRRWDQVGADPAFCFGHGLGYTDWEYERVEVPAMVPAGADAFVRVVVTNTGDRAGGEAIQVYAAREDSRVERPARWLAGFARVWAEPGETVTVDVPLPSASLAHWDVAGGWRVEPGTFQLAIGRSIDDVQLHADLVVD